MRETGLFLRVFFFWTKNYELGSCTARSVFVLILYTFHSTHAQLLKSVRQFKDKGRSRQSMLLYGHGDGGGGPTLVDRLMDTCFYLDLEVFSVTVQ